MENKLGRGFGIQSRIKDTSFYIVLHRRREICGIKNEKKKKKKRFRLGEGIAVSIVAHASLFSQNETGGTRYYRCGFYYILLASRHKWDMSIELLLTRAIPDDEADYISAIATRRQQLGRGCLLRENGRCMYNLIRYRSITHGRQPGISRRYTRCIGDAALAIYFSTRREFCVGFPLAQNFEERLSDNVFFLFF